MGWYYGLINMKSWYEHENFKAWNNLVFGGFLIEVFGIL